MSNIFDETQEEFDAKMWKSLEQVKQGKTRPIEEFWEEFEKKFDDAIQSRNSRAS